MSTEIRVHHLAVFDRHEECTHPSGFRYQGTIPNTGKQVCPICGAEKVSVPEPRASIFTEEQEAQLRRLKALRPFRIVWGAVNTQTEPHTFETHATVTRHRLNRYLRAGWLVATIE